jgi:hypothetical protein
VHRIDRAVRGRRGGGRPQDGVRDAESDFFPFHVPAGLSCTGSLIDPQSGESRIPALLGPQPQRNKTEQENRHRCKDGPTLARVSDHHPERVTERRRDEQDRENLEKIGPGRRVLKRMSRIDIEESTAVGPKLLDRNLRGCRSDCEYLFGCRRRLCFRLALFIQHRLAVRIRHGLGITGRLEQRGGLV